MVGARKQTLSLVYAKPVASPPPYKANPVPWPSSATRHPLLLLPLSLSLLLLSSSIPFSFPLPTRNLWLQYININIYTWNSSCFRIYPLVERRNLLVTWMDKEIRLPPGFRFHPTDEELVVQYLRRKVLRCPLPSFVIPEIQLSRYDPWDLPGGGGGEKERYLFHLREDKNRRGRGSSRATASGYWKATGKEREIVSSKGSRAVGMKKALVFYRGKPSRGLRTDWVMHEYRLCDIAGTSPLLSLKLHAVDWVLCRVFQKKRAGATDMDRHWNNRAIGRGATPAAGSIAREDGGIDSGELSCVTENSDGSCGEDEEGCCSKSSSPARWAA